MRRAPTGDRVVTAEGWIEDLDKGGRAGLAAAAVAVGLAVVAVLYAIVVLQGIVSSVSSSFPSESPRPLPSITAQR
ncbi:MAG: hypothetical protein U0Q15_06255 [Kineosporiaceae bacterium]